MNREKLLKIFEKFGDEITYLRDECIIYAGHVPRVGILLLEGKLELQMTRSKKLLPCGSIVGLKELKENRQSKYTIKAFSNTKIITINKSILNSILKKKNEKSILENLKGND